MTRIIEQSAWHWHALNGGAAIHDDTPPQPGWYKRRLVPRGPFVPARIWIERDESDGEIVSDDKYGCEVGDEPRDAFEEWLYLCKNPITQEEWSLLK